VDIALQIFLYCLILGSCVGFLAGLLGIGGGLVIVPALIILLPLTGVSSDSLMPMVLATSLAAILLTAISTLVTHHKKGNIPRFFLPPLLIGVGCGALVGGYFADSVPSDLLQIMFAIFAILMSVQIWFGAKKIDGCCKTRPEYNSLILFFVCFVIGAISSLLGIGGGVLLVPFLTMIVKLDMRRSIGVSAAVGFVVAIMGTIGYLTAGLSMTHPLTDWSVGYIYLPALLGIICVSLFTAPLGVCAAQYVSVAVLKRCFSFLLFVVAAEILLG